MAPGEVAGAVLVFHDVTGTRRAQQALRDSESRLHTLSDNLAGRCDLPVLPRH